MKINNPRFLFLIIASILSACSGGGGDEEQSGSLGAKVEGFRLVPSTLDNRDCQILDFNDRSEILFACEDSNNPVVGTKFALWTGGETLKDLREERSLPPETPSTGITFIRLANDGKLFGVNLDVDSIDNESGVTFHSSSGFISTKDELITLTDPIAGASRDGSFYFTEQTNGQVDFQIEPSVFHDNKPFTLEPAPKGFFNSGYRYAIRNDGTLAGVVNAGETNQSFVASYGVLQSAHSFDLLASPGRSGLSYVTGIIINNTGSAVLQYQKDETYDVVIDGAYFSTQTVRGAALVLSDGQEFSVAHPNPEVDIDAYQINDNNIVSGIFSNQKVLLAANEINDSSLIGPFLYSPRSGFKQVSEVFPIETGAWISGLNNKNEVVLSLVDGSVVIAQLPADF